jgi:hypothetical protein
MRHVSLQRWVAPIGLRLAIYRAPGAACLQSSALLKPILSDVLPSHLVREIKHFQPITISAVLTRSASF